jgi:thiol-disulfide isomerase/thioredoxin
MSGYGKSVPIVALAMAWTVGCAAAITAEDKPADTPSLDTQYPGLATSALTYAKSANLPPGVLLKAGDLTILEKDVADKIAQAPQPQRDLLRKNAFYLLENMAGTKLLVLEAKAHLSAVDPNVKEQDLIQRYLGGLVAKVTASDREVADLYEANKDAVGGATFDQIKDQVGEVVLQQKRQEWVNEYIRALGQRVSIAVSAAWAKEQSVLAKDNPVDKARASGRPSMVDFGSTGCQPCDMLAPILQTLKTKYAGKVNVLFVHVNQEPILAARYGVRTIPIQFFYDKDGKEVFRHVGFWPQAEIEKKLAEMGVK